MCSRTLSLTIYLLLILLLFTFGESQCDSNLPSSNSNIDCQKCLTNKSSDSCVYKQCVGMCCGEQPLQSCYSTYANANPLKLGSSNNDKSTYPISYIWVVYFLGGLGAAIVFIIVLYKCQKRQHQINLHQLNQPPILNLQEPNLRHAQQVAQMQGPMQSNSNKVQTVHPNYAKIFQNNICAVCLQEELNTKSLCGHQFHLKCILAWLSRKHDCPVCRQEIKQIIVYCRSCYQYYVSIDVNAKRTLDDIERVVNRYTCTVCSKRLSVLESNLL